MVKLFTRITRQIHYTALQTDTRRLWRFKTQ